MVRRFNFIRNNNVVITQNHAFQQAMRHAVCHYPSNAVYSFIPKNACTTLRASLAVANGFIEPARLNEQINWVHNNSFTFSADLAGLVNADYTFVILRNPYDRIVSLFLDKFVDKTPVAWTFYRGCNNRIDLDSLSFEEFLDHLLVKPRLRAIDIHLRPQTHFLIYKQYDDYFNMSDFGHICTTLKNKINLDIVDTRNITNHGREKYTELVENDYACITVNELKKMKLNGSLPSVEALCNEKCRTIIRQIYKDDFDLMDEKLPHWR